MGELMLRTRRRSTRLGPLHRETAEHQALDERCDRLIAPLARAGWIGQRVAQTTLHNVPCARFDRLHAEAVGQNPIRARRDFRLQIRVARSRHLRRRAANDVDVRDNRARRRTVKGLLRPTKRDRRTKRRVAIHRRGRRHTHVGGPPGAVGCEFHEVVDRARADRNRDRVVRAQRHFEQICVLEKQPDWARWWLAQPFRCLAHNGEINTVRGNKNWMLSHEIRMASLAFGEHSEDIKPVIPAGASDTAALDAVFEAICRSGRDAPTAKLMLVPEAMAPNSDMPAEHLAMYQYLASVMEPWDGPAALAMTDGRWAVAGMDRNALRPLRYTLTAEGLLIVGSESGMVVVPEASIVAKGRLGPGQMIAVDLDEGLLMLDRAVKDRIAGEADYAAMIGNFLKIDDLPVPAETVTRFERAELTRRQVAAGQTLEDMELILAPMVESAKEAIGSMGDDTPLAVISDKPRLISQFFRQNFSQVTNPPIDSLRERHVMSLKTRFGNLANILDTEDRRDGVLVLDSPVLTRTDQWVIRAAKRLGFIDRLTPAGRTLGRREEFADLDAARSYFAGKPLFRGFDPECFDAYLQHGLYQVGDRLRLRFDPATEISIYRGVPHTSPGQVRQLKVPLAVVRGRQSRVVMRHHASGVGRLPMGEMLTMPGGHMFPLERPQDTATLLKQLFARWEARER
eukprot:gene32541-43471_t